MNDAAIEFRAATPADAEALAALINFAGEGMPLYLWSRMAGPDEDPWAVGRARACRDEGSFSYRNSTIAEIGDRLVGCLIGYALPETPVPSNLEGMPPMFVPLQELEDLAPNTWYVNVVAVYPESRGHGVGSALLERAEQLARESRRPGLSLIVADSNARARKLYARKGYREIATRPLVREQWETEARNWVLMIKALAATSPGQGGPGKRH